MGNCFVPHLSSPRANHDFHDSLYTLHSVYCFCNKRLFSFISFYPIQIYPWAVFALSGPILLIIQHHLGKTNTPAEMVNPFLARATAALQIKLWLSGKRVFTFSNLHWCELSSCLAFQIGVAKQTCKYFRSFLNPAQFCSQYFTRALPCSFIVYKIQSPIFFNSLFLCSRYGAHLSAGCAHTYIRSI